jgi:hypothetical protein
MAKKTEPQIKTGESVNGSDQKTAQPAFLSLCFELLERREYTKLLGELESVDLSGDNGTFAYLKANCCMNLGDYAEACGAISLSLSRDPENIDFQLTHGLCLDRHGKWVEAMGVFNEIIQKHPAEKRAHGHLAHVLMRM